MYVHILALNPSVIPVHALCTLCASPYPSLVSLLFMPSVHSLVIIHRVLAFLLLFLLLSEFLLVCQRKKDMHIWIEHLQSQNAELFVGNKNQKIQPYIARMRLQSSANTWMTGKCLFLSDLDSTWLKRATGAPGEIALTFQFSSHHITSHHKTDT